jgi:hypothetical protein
MDKNLIKRLSKGAIEYYVAAYDHVLNGVVGNQSPIIRDSFTSTFNTFVDLLERLEPTVLLSTKNAQEVDELILSGGSHFLYRNCVLHDPKSNSEFVSMLVVGIEDLPEGIKDGISLFGEDGKNLTVGLLIFITASQKICKFEPVALLAKKSANGKLETAPYPLVWAFPVEGQTDRLVIGSDLTTDMERVAERLNFLLHMVGDEHAAQLYKADLVGEMDSKILN